MRVTESEGQELALNIYAVTYTYKFLLLLETGRNANYHVVNKCAIETVH